MKNEQSAIGCTGCLIIIAILSICLFLTALIGVL